MEITRMKIKAGVCRFFLNEKNIYEYVINDEIAEVKIELFPKKKDKSKRVAKDYKWLDGSSLVFLDDYGYLLKDDIKKDKVSQASIKKFLYILTQGKLSILHTRSGATEEYEQSFESTTNLKCAEINTLTTITAFAPAEFGFASSQSLTEKPNLAKETAPLITEYADQLCAYKIELLSVEKQIKAQEKSAEANKETKELIDLCINEYKEKKIIRPNLSKDKFAKDFAKTHGLNKNRVIHWLKNI